ncbi:hypothetical protein SAMN06265338_13010 [Rhodoblastus acidophilus]|uniref:Uncharacterized protein n=1 Tax=Rhodoblastus acidophilus TaxID=1074 RepID=A0A212SDR2_RHOAC|nr:hypothetical protein [Rhodoblastus acidophilus]PPQ34967.1 hypothetical protein CKO16_21390 [Rhodoblastus acidophilus]RAI16811.1 hypothetical protein CH337_19430 [Rhodoblastus acidophilus]SNB83795.1 hypothetical protein SAMN06265338_13010 [Rhodoblastus acidophilus]
MNDEMKKKRLDQIDRLLSISTEVLDVEPAVYGLPCRKRRMKAVISGQIFIAAKNILAVVEEMMAELDADKPEAQI